MAAICASTVQYFRALLHRPSEVEAAVVACQVLGSLTAACNATAQARSHAWYLLQLRCTARQVLPMGSTLLDSQSTGQGLGPCRLCRVMQWLACERAKSFVAYVVDLEHGEHTS